MIYALTAITVLVSCGVRIQVASAQQSGTVQNQEAAPAALWNSPSIAPKGPQTSSPAAPPRDNSGTWDAFNSGIGAGGVKSHAPFTDLGKKMADSYKPGDGPRKVEVGLINDPLDECDPAGFPRDLLFELRPFDVVQLPDRVVMLYEYQKIWRVIWTDGRELPKNPEPRWYGYSVGHWDDDSTFVVNTMGMNDKTWLDNAGDPHSADMRVEERYHRVDRDTMEITVKIDDPKIYTEPWLGLNKLVLRRQPKSFDIREMICSPTEAAEYKKMVADPATEK